MVTGILSDGKETAAHSRAVITELEKNCEATVSKDLKGPVTTGHILCECPVCVKNAVLAAGEEMKLQ